MRAALLCAVALAWAPGLASAQTPDSTGVLATPGGEVTVLDSSAAPRRPLVAPFGPAPGLDLTPVPAVTATLSLGGLLDDATPALARPPRPLAAPSAFAYALGAPGRVAGVSLDGQAPDAPALTLDGRPYADPFTDAPRLDLLPLALVGPVRLADGARGRATALSVGTRDLRVAVPVTELRYHGGQSGLLHASGSHAQTRRPPAFLRGGSDDARLTLTFHAATRGADGALAGARLRHTDALGRLLLTRPGLAAEVGVVYADRTEGARRGVVPDAPGLDGVFSFDTATPLESGAERRSTRTEGWARARVPVLAAPAELGASVGVHRTAYAGGGAPVRLLGARATAFAEQPLAAGRHRLALRVEGVYDRAPVQDTTAASGGDLSGVGSRLGVHVTATDSLAVGPVRLALGAGVHRVGGEAWPSASVRAGSGAAWVGARLGGRAVSRLEQTGLARVLAVGPDAPTTRTLAADAGLALAAGDWRLVLTAFASAERDGRHWVATGDAVLAYTVASMTQGGGGAVVGWRERTRRGLYARVDAHARALAGPDTDVLRRLDRALPRVWGGARVGLRAEGVGDGVLDLDLAAVGHAWSAFRSRLVEPTTGVLALPRPGADLGLELPARGTLGLEATATFSTRASLFVRYDHALGGRLYDGAIVTQGEPLVPEVLRFGVFWALLN